MKWIHSLICGLPFIPNIFCASGDEGLVPRKKDKWYRPKNDKSGTPINAYHPDIPDRIETPFPTEVGLKGSKSQYLPRNVYNEQQQEQVPITPQPHRAAPQARSIAEEKGKEKETLDLYEQQQAIEFAMDEYDEGAETEVPPEHHRRQRSDSERPLHSTQYANSHPLRASVFHSPIPVAIRGNRERDTRPPPSHKDSTSIREGRSGFHRSVHQGTAPRPLLTPRLIKEKDTPMYERQNFEWKYTSLLIDRLFDHLVLREDDEQTCALIMQEKNYLLRLVTYRDA